MKDGRVGDGRIGVQRSGRETGESLVDGSQDVGDCHFVDVNQAEGRQERVALHSEQRREGVQVLRGDGSANGEGFEKD